MSRILIVAPSWVGDTVLMQPLLRRIQERHPESRIDVLAPPWTAPLLSRMPEVSEIIENPFRHGELMLGNRLRLGRKLRERRYGQAIILPNSLKSALIPFFASIPVRTGFVGEMRKGLLNDARKLHKARYPLMIERFLLLAEDRDCALHQPIRSPKLSVSETQRREALAKFAPDCSKPIAAFCPGAEYGPAKRWPARHFAELAKSLQSRFQILLLGSPKDFEIGEQIRELAGDACVNLCGKSKLNEAIDLIASAALVVSNDSGLMHVGAALDKPMIALYGSSSPGFTPPLSERAQVVKLDLPCSPCFERECPLGHFDCMTRLTPEQVLSRIEQLELS